MSKNLNQQQLDTRSSHELDDSRLARTTPRMVLCRTSQSRPYGTNPKSGASNLHKLSGSRSLFGSLHMHRAWVGGRLRSNAVKHPHIRRLRWRSHSTTSRSGARILAGCRSTTSHGVGLRISSVARSCAAVATLTS